MMQVSTSDELNLASYDRILEQLAIIILSSCGEVQIITQRAQRLLYRYGQSLLQPEDDLSHTLQHWINHQILLLQSSTIFTPRRPLQIEHRNKQLNIRFISEYPGDYYLLLLEEQPLFEVSAQAFECLGLTKREAEVLYWIAQGKTTSEISDLLKISSLTVKKHIEHIYNKFGVQTRPAALMYAFEQLGILN